MATRELTSHQEGRRGRPRVPVLIYHGVGANGVAPSGARERKYWLPASELRRQLELIRRSGYHVALLAELRRGAACRREAVDAIVLSFDDGRASDYEVAFPLLAEAGLHAEFFVNTATIGTPGFLDWPRIQEMERAGMSFQSHGHDHVALPVLSERFLRNQLRESKRRLEDRVGRAVDFFAVPYGLTSRRVERVARQEGYCAVCTSRPWPARPWARTVNRVAVHRNTADVEFLGLLAGDPVFYAPRLLRTALLHFPKRILLRLRPDRLRVRTLETAR